MAVKQYWEPDSQWQQIFFKSKLFGEANQFDYRSFINHQACHPGLDPGSRLLEMNQPEHYTEVGYTLKYLED